MLCCGGRHPEGTRPGAATEKEIRGRPGTLWVPPPNPHQRASFLANLVLLTSRASVRYFLAKTFGSKQAIDQRLLEYNYFARIRVTSRILNQIFRTVRAGCHSAARRHS